jgi:2-phosphosulfolactate phosphatase
MAITAVALGRRCLVVESLEAARATASRLQQPLLSGELGGHMPEGFDMNNSPAQLVQRNDLHRPMVLLSSSGTQLICGAGRRTASVYLACFRNFSAVARRVAGQHERVAVIGAGSRNEFREEDQMCCAWVAELLIGSGYEAGNALTREIVQRWSSAPPSACRVSNSIGYLRRTDQLRDLDFILAHIDDLGDSFGLRGDEVIAVTKCEEAAMEAA